MLMGDIVQKSINNFFSLCKEKNIEPSLEEDDIVSECYLVFMNSIEKIDFKYKTSFHFYYNKSITRFLYRVFEKLAREKVYVRNFEDITIFAQHRTSHNSADFVDYYCEKMRLTKIQKKIVLHKMSPTLSVDEFIAKNRLNKKKYKENLKIVEQKTLSMLSE